MARFQAHRRRILGPLLSCALAIVAGPRAQETIQLPVPLTAGMFIDRSVTIQPRTYRLAAAADLKTPALVVRTATIPAGDCMLRVISDDGVRVWVDDELAVDAWEPHESRVDTAPLTGGKRRFKVEYYEIGGFAELRFTIQRK